MLLTVLASIIFVSVLEDESIVTAHSSEQVNSAESVSQLWQQIKSSLRRRNQIQHIMIRKDQIDSLLGLANRAIPNLSGQAELRNFRSELALSYRMPDTPFGHYINIKIAVNAGQKLQIDGVTLGYIHIPGDWALKMILFLADWHTDSDIASQFVEQIEKVRLFESSVVVTFLPLSDFLKQLNKLKDGLSVDQNQPLKIRTAYYMKFISRLSVTRKASFPSLSEYMKPLFSDVQTRSIDSDPVLENEAAILALAIYAGHHRLANLVGDVQPSNGMVLLPDYRPLLAGRIDLTRHFLISAAIKILSQQGVSNAIGEFKELMDRGLGGSGFSFVDLAADMAGVRFALLASDPNTANQVQNLLANVSAENEYFPDISGLPEGLDKSTFLKVFGTVDSNAYKAQVELIESRLNKVRLFSASNYAIQE